MGLVHNRGNQWQFISEAALENFVWQHLGELFHLSPLERQFVCQGEVCDILALSADRQLHVLELKNAADCYLIQQLIRYHANLQETQPFAWNLLCVPHEDGKTTLSGINLYPNVWKHIATIQNLRQHPYEFYQKSGFVIVGVMPDANGLGKPDIYMAKQL